MAFTSNELTNIANATLEGFLDKGKVWKQNVANKPMFDAFNTTAGKFAGGNQKVSLAVSVGASGTLAGYTHDDQVSFYNPANIKRVGYTWKEHHIGVTLTHTELKISGVDVTDENASTSAISGREAFVLANLLDEKMEDLGESFAFGFDQLLHRDGTGDTKAIAGIKSIILDDPTAGSTGGLARSNIWWRNDAATAAYATAGGQGAIVSSATGGGALIAFLDKAARRRAKYANGSTNVKAFCGSDFLDAYAAELRANGNYSMTGFTKPQDGSMGSLSHAGVELVYDPTLDAENNSKRAYFIDMGRAGVRMLYLDGQRMKKHEPARPFDRYVIYTGVTSTAVLIAKQLNTSGVYDIA